MCIRYSREKGHFQIYDKNLKGWVYISEDHALVRAKYPGGRADVVMRDAAGAIVAQQALWGLQPFWAKKPNWGRQNAYNARAETVAEKPTWRGPLKKQRCLVPADDFYERSPDLQRWLRFTKADGASMSFAGLYEPPNSASQEFTFAFVTTEPNVDVVDVHDRMPVILNPDDYDLWLDPDAPKEDLLALLTPAPDGSLKYEDAGPIKVAKASSEKLIED